MVFGQESPKMRRTGEQGVDGAVHKHRNAQQRSGNLGREERLDDRQDRKGTEPRRVHVQRQVQVCRIVRKTTSPRGHRQERKHGQQDEHAFGQDAVDLAIELGVLERGSHEAIAPEDARGKAILHGLEHLWRQRRAAVGIGDGDLGDFAASAM